MNSYEQFFESRKLRFTKAITYDYNDSFGEKQGLLIMSDEDPYRSVYPNKHEQNLKNSVDVIVNGELVKDSLSYRLVHEDWTGKTKNYIELYSKDFLVKAVEDGISRCIKHDTIVSIQKFPVTHLRPLKVHVGHNRLLYIKKSEDSDNPYGIEFEVSPSNMITTDYSIWYAVFKIMAKDYIKILKSVKWPKEFIDTLPESDKNLLRSSVAMKKFNIG